MRHISMLPPQNEPAYRARMREREERWTEQRRLAFLIEMKEQDRSWPDPVELLRDVIAKRHAVLGMNS